MLTILSANENLLERLELLIQNTPKPADCSGRAVQARTVLLNNSTATSGLPIQMPTCRDGSEANFEEEKSTKCCTKWMLLMAKKGFEEHPTTLETLADLFRLSLAMSGTMQNENTADDRQQQLEEGKAMRILILKKERAEEDEHSLRAHMDTVKQEWSEQWAGQVDRLRRFGESDASREQLDRAKQWTEDTQHSNLMTCALAYFDDPNLMRTINKFFQFGDGFEIAEEFSEEDESEKRQHLFTKAPALHWTNYPRESEVQVTFKFSFPKGTVPEWLFRQWIRGAKELLAWDYEYEWTNGCLLRADEMVKICVSRAASEPNVVEVSGRIDTDEAAEEEEQEREEKRKKQLLAKEEGEQENGLSVEATSKDGASPPLQKVWPYLVRNFQNILTDIESRKTLPFCLSLVFIGELFFKCPEGIQKIGARSLDAIQTLSSIQRIKTVRFRADQEQIYALDLDQCFPNFQPTKLSDFAADKFPLPAPKLSVASSSSSPSEVATAVTSLAGSAILINSALHSPRVVEKARVDRSPSCVPSFGLLAEEESGDGGHSPGSIRKSKQQQQQQQPSSLSSSPQPGQSLHVERQLGGYKNRGRRVSFGVIHSIPSQGEQNSGLSSQAGATSPLLMSLSASTRFTTSPESQKNGKVTETGDEQQDEEKGENVLVESIVDEMLKKAIEEVMITAE